MARLAVVTDAADHVPIPAPKVPRPCADLPARGVVLVVAPHPDDEVIGPGATLVRHVRAGDPVHGLWVTTGVHGDASGTRDVGEYTALRRREAEAAAAVVGFSSTEFWDYPDSMVVTEGDLVGATGQLVGVLERVRPDVVYVPHLGESHSDHHVTALMVQRALAQWGGSATTYGYEVWSPLDADLVVEVADVYDVKLEAIRCYASQLEHNDICRAVDGLNRYRSVLLPPGGLYAEAFVEWGRA